MSQQIKRKYLEDAIINGQKIESNAVGSAKIRLESNSALRARNAANSADVELLKLDGADKLQLLKMPQVSADPVDANDLVRKSHLDAELATAAGVVEAIEGRVDAIEEDYAQPNGLATLDSGGKVPVAQLPNAIMQYKGIWDPSTNTPTLSNTGNDPEELGSVYRINVSGSVDLGSGTLSFAGGDYIILGENGWEKADGTDAVQSVHGRTGDVTAQSGDYTTEQVTESGDSRYFTQAREDALEQLVSDEAIARAAADEELLKLDGSRPMEGNLSMGSASSPLSVSATVGPDGEKLYNEQLSDPAFVLGMPVIVNGSSYDLADRADDGDGLYIRVYIPATTTFATFPLGFPVTVTASSGGSSSSYKIVNLADGTDAADAVNKGQLDAAISSEQGSREAADLVLQGEIDAEELARQSADDALDLRIDALESAAVEFVKERFVVSAGDITAGYIDLANEAIANSICAYVDRLAIHEGTSEDYTVSVVAGKTRITFVGNLVSPSAEQLAAGDVITVKYAI